MNGHNQELDQQEASRRRVYPQILAALTAFTLFAMVEQHTMDPLEAVMNFTIDHH